MSCGSSTFSFHSLAHAPLRPEQISMCFVKFAYPVERVRLFPSEEILKGSAVTASADWKPAWVVVGESSLLGDPYFLDVSKPDPEGDCPVYTAMSGQERWAPTLAASRADCIPGAVLGLPRARFWSSRSLSEPS